MFAHGAAHASSCSRYVLAKNGPRRAQFAHARTGLCPYPRGATAKTRGGPTPAAVVPTDSTGRYSSVLTAAHWWGNPSVASPMLFWCPTPAVCMQSRGDSELMPRHFRIRKLRRDICGRDACSTGLKCTVFLEQGPARTVEIPACAYHCSEQLRARARSAAETANDRRADCCRLNHGHRRRKINTTQRRSFRLMTWNDSCTSTVHPDFVFSERTNKGISRTLVFQMSDTWELLRRRQPEPWGRHVVLRHAHGATEYNGHLDWIVNLGSGRFDFFCSCLSKLCTKKQHKTPWSLNGCRSATQHCWVALNVFIMNSERRCFGKTS